MSIGLDLGCDQFRSIRSAEGELIARCCPAVFAAIPDSAAHRRLLQQSNTRFATCSDQLLVFGEEAREWSAMLNVAEMPLLRGGRLAGSDAISRQVLTLMMDAMLPIPAEVNSICCMTLPGGGGDPRTESRDGEFLQQLVTLRGYRPRLMTSTMALALAELNDDSFTGITISLGHATSEFGIVHCGRELLRCVVMSGLEQFAGSQRLGGVNSAAMEPLAAETSVDRDYVRFFKDVITEARSQFAFDGTLKTLPRLMPVICAGAITSEPAFLPLFQRAWDESEWPAATRPIRISGDSNLSIARGCLIQAELDQPSERQAA